VIWVENVPKILPQKTNVAAAAETFIDKSVFIREDIKAKSFVVYDVTNSSIIFGRNETDQLPLASLTKMMTGLAAIESAPAYVSVKFETPFKTDWDLKDLISYTLVTSSNAGADAIADAINYLIDQGNIVPRNCPNTEECSFVDIMNETAERLNLSQTYFTNSTGLDWSNDLTGGYGSALDMARLISYLFKNHPSLINPTTKTQIPITNSLGNTVYSNNTNSEVENIPGIQGSKTGFTDLAGGNLAIIYDAGIDEQYAIVVLGSTETERFEDVKKLIKANNEFLALYDN
jgi:D-alanyl-D-alanine carboxypeptidase (penicillin-binding protein 5/6)